MICSFPSGISIIYLLLYIYIYEDKKYVNIKYVMHNINNSKDIYLYSYTYFSNLSNNLPRHQ
jgi:hypothetical protein